MVTRTDSWVLSRGALIGIGVAVVAAVVVVVSGIREQNRRQVPTARSVAIWSATTSQIETGPVEFGPVHAQALVEIINRLGRMPNGRYNCAADTGSHYRLVLATASGDIEVRDSLGGCLGVAISSRGQDWASGRWDPAGDLAAAIRTDLASNDRR